MSGTLARLAGWSFAHRRWVVAGWLTLVLAVAAAALALHRSTDDTFNVPGTESQRALDLLDRQFPGAGGATARLVFAAPRGHTLDEARYRAVITPTVALARAVPQSLPNPKAFETSLRVSRDRRIAFADLHFLVPVSKLSTTTKSALARVAAPARRAGLEVEFSGGVATTSVSGNGTPELVGLAVALAILMIVFGTLVTAVLPLAIALVAVAIGLLGISALSGLVALNSTAPTLAAMLGLAVGIDYALFVVTRHREELALGASPETAVHVAASTAGIAVCFAGSTVIVALVGMLVVGIPFLSLMGLAAAGTVFIAVLAVLTLLPALLGFAGDRVRGGRHIAPDRALGGRWARSLTSRPLVAIPVVIVLLAVIATPALDLRLGLPDDGGQPAGSTEREAYDLLVAGFGAGYTGPLTVVGDARRVADPKKAVTAVVMTLQSLPGVADVSAPAFDADGKIAVVAVTPDDGPASQQTKDLVALLRGRARDAERRYGITGYVTGRTAVNIDTSDKIAAGLPRFVAVVVGIALVLLFVAFGSVAVPGTAVAGFLLTIGAALGATTWCFQDGHLVSLLGIPEPGPVVSFLPVLLIAILFGLAMDYEVFLLTRMREARAGGAEPAAAVISGLSVSARVVTAAALIMVSVFSAFVADPSVFIKSIAFSLAFGVLVDAFLIRMTLIPALLALLGARAWWRPSRPGRGSRRPGRHRRRASAS